MYTINTKTKRKQFSVKESENKVDSEWAKGFDQVSTGTLQLLSCFYTIYTPLVCMYVCVRN